MRNNIIIGLVCFVLGALLAFKLLPKNEPYQPVISSKADAQGQAAAKCIVTKKTDSQGNVTETVESTTDLKQSAASEIKQERPDKASLNGLFFGPSVDNNLKAKIGPSIVHNEWLFNLETDGNKDHYIGIKYKVFGWQ